MADSQVRALFEDLVVAHWIIRDEKTVLFARKHFQHTQLRHAERLTRHDRPRDEFPNTPSLTAEEVAALEADFGALETAYQRPWYGSLKQRIDEHTASLTDEEKAEWEAFVDSVYPGLHLRAHNSPAGLNALFFEAQDKGVLEDPSAIGDYMTPSHRLVRASLSNANWVFRRLLALTHIQFGLVNDTETFERLVEQNRKRDTSESKSRPRGRARRRR